MRLWRMVFFCVCNLGGNCHDVDGCSVWPPPVFRHDASAWSAEDLATFVGVSGFACILLFMKNGWVEIVNQSDSVFGFVGLLCII